VEQVGDTHADIAEKSKSTIESLSAIERTLVDVDRESPRDTLRHPAGLSDTLVDLINTAGIADMAPTASAEAVSREIMASVDAQRAGLDALLTSDIPDINKRAKDRSIAHVAL
jgi:hypothetical protein